jgi:hypothetical protein
MDMVLQFLAPVPAVVGIAVIVWRLSVDSRPVRKSGVDGMEKTRRARPAVGQLALAGASDSPPRPDPVLDYAAAVTNTTLIAEH